MWPYWSSSLEEKGQRSRLTPLASLAFAFIVSGILFGEERIIGYSLMGVGVVLAIVDIIIRAKKNHEK